MKKALALAALTFAITLIVAACGSDEEKPTFAVAGIPDQDTDRLARRYEVLTEYLSEELDLNVEFVPTVDYAATVTGFRQGDIQMAWFGGLTGVQARLAVPGSEAIAHRPRDAEFHSRFIVNTSVDAQTLEDLRGLTFTFGSESSTSGHLMPRFFLLQAGIDPETDFNGKPNFSGSHDTTWKLVESGAFQAGALNEAVWEAALSSGEVDTTRLRELGTTPPYFDYNWTIRGDADDTYGDGFIEKVRQALLKIDGETPEILDLFSTDSFVETNNYNYQAIQDVAESLGIIR